VQRMLTIVSQMTCIAGQPRRRYRLATLLLAVFVVNLGLGWLARNLRREKEHVALIPELNQAGIYGRR
jgi:hypothetical protein